MACIVMSYVVMAYVVMATRKVGFRTLALVTGNDTDSTFLKRASTEEGSEDFTVGHGVGQEGRPHG